MAIFLLPVPTLLCVCLLMAYGYASVRWWGGFTPNDCSAISRIITLIAAPLLSFSIIAANNPYATNLRFLAADTLQKLLILAALAAWARDRPAWIATLFSLTSLPNTLALLPLFDLGGTIDDSRLMAQIIVPQIIVWYNLVLFLYEYNAAAEATEGGILGPLEEGFIAKENGASTTTVIRIALRNLIKNANVYAGILGLIWSLIAFSRWGFRMPYIIEQVISPSSFLSSKVSMVSLGIFMARESKDVSCDYSLAALAMAVKFLIAPIIMALCSLAVGLRGEFLHLSILQAAMPLPVLSFVYAIEYNVHPEIMSIGVIHGIIIALMAHAIN